MFPTSKKFLRIILIFVLVFAWIFSGWPQIWKNPAFPPEIQEAQADTTGAKYPTLGEAVSESPWSDNNWTSPTNIYADDATDASVTATTYDSPDQTRVLKATGFDFSSIPDNSTINGVIARINTYYANGTVSIDLAQLLDTSKARVGTNQYASPVALSTSSSTILTTGSSTDTWGNSLTAAWVKNANFGVGLGFLATGTDSDVFVDYVTIEIYYTPPVAPSITVPASVTMPNYTLGGIGYSERNFQDVSALVQITAGVGFTVTVSSTNLTGTNNTISNSNVKLKTDGTVSTNPTVITNCTGYSGITETASGEYSLNTAQTIVTTSSGSGTCDIYPTIRVYIDNNGTYVEQDSGTLTFTITTP